MNENKSKMIDGVLNIYCEADGKYYPKHIVSDGLRMELDEKHFIYVLAGDTVDESIERDMKADIHFPPDDYEDGLYNLSIYYGVERNEYLKEYKPEEYAELKESGNLEKHLIDIDIRARELEETLTVEYAERDGLTSEMKAQNMTQWVGMMNNIKHNVREQIQKELIYI